MFSSSSVVLDRVFPLLCDLLPYKFSEDSTQWINDQRLMVLLNTQKKKKGGRDTVSARFIAIRFDLVRMCVRVCVCTLCVLFLFLSVLFCLTCLSVCRPPGK